MGLPVIAAAKLSLVAATHNGLTPVVANMFWPFLLKFSFSFRPIHDGCTDLAHALRLFFFQMRHIAFDSGAAANEDGGVRWQRALRLVYQRIVHTTARRAQSSEDSLIALSMLAL